MNTSERNAPAAGSSERNIRMPWRVSADCTALAWKPNCASIHPVMAVPNAHPNFWLIDDDEKIRPVARLPVCSSL